MAKNNDKKDKNIKIKFNPTGNVFYLPKAEVDEIMNSSDKHNFEVLDKNYVLKKEPKEEKTTVFQQVVIDEAKAKAEADKKVEDKEVKAKADKEQDK